MSGTYKIVKNGDGYSPHELLDTETGKKVFLCSCGCTKNKDHFCDSSHKKKKKRCYCCNDE